MMYLVKAFKGNDVMTLLNQQSGDEDLISAVLNIGYNKSGSLTISMPHNHRAFNQMQGISTIVKVYQFINGNEVWLFTGRVISKDEDFYKTGTFTAEGILSYLCDTIVRAYEYQGTPDDYVKQLIQQHNSQVDEDKQFTLGTLGLIDTESNNNIVRANSNYPNTATEFKDKVIDALNVYAFAEEKDGKNILNVSHNITSRNSQRIEFSENIINLTQSKKMQDVKTVLVPLGAKDEDGNRLTVSAINDGKDYIYDAEAAGRYGIIVGTVEFDDVTLAENLLNKANAYLKECINPMQRIEIKAVDLSIARQEIMNIKLGWAHVFSAVHNIDTDMLITDMTMDLINPENNIYTLGSTQKTCTDLNATRKRDISKEIQSIRTTTSKKIESAIKNATELITGAQGGYVLLDGDNNGHPERILIMDNPDKTLANHVIQINKNGIGFSTSGYNGPYANAWTIDGNLVADFITAGTMFADRIRGGTLEIGGEKDGRITVLDKDSNTVAAIGREGVDVFKGSIRGAEIIAGGTNNADGTITVLDEKGGTVVTIGKDGLTVIKGSISGTTIISSDGEKWIKISSGGITMGSGENTTGKINFSTGGLEFRGKELTFCMDKIKCGTSMNATNTKTAYTGDIKYAVKQEDDSIGNAVMNFRNGILMQNG